MNPWVLALACGLGFGLISVALMVPMTFADKATAMAAAFASRFAIGFLVPLVSMPVPGLAKGIVVGLLISLPEAIVTKAYLPILVIGALGGGVIGWIAGNPAWNGYAGT